MNCQKCQSSRIVEIGGKCSDMCWVSIGDRSYDGYVPDDLGVGGGDYLNITYCLDCGYLQGAWPLSKSQLEEAIHCPDECGYEGMPQDDSVSRLADDRRYRYKCPQCGEKGSAKDWGLGR